MAKIGIFYGSTTGTCEDIANRIAEKVGGEAISAADLTADKVNEFDVLLLGSSTWGAGDMQDDWYDAIETVKGMSLAGKKVALFAVGDSDGFASTFCGSLAGLYEGVKDTGCTFVGQVSIDGYNSGVEESDGVVDGKFLGLAIDETNEADKTDARIDAWVASLAL